MELSIQGAILAVAFEENASHTNSSPQNIAFKTGIFTAPSPNDSAQSIGNSIDHSLSSIQTNDDLINKQPVAERFDLATKIISNIKQDLLGCACVKDIENDNVHTCCQRSNLINQINELQELIDGIKA